MKHIAIDIVNNIGEIWLQLYSPDGYQRSLGLIELASVWLDSQSSCWEVLVSMGSIDVIEPTRFT